VPSVRLIDEANAQVGIVATDLALSKAREVGLDLVEVSPTSEPPVCRIMDYGKWLYEQKRKVREAHKKHPKHVTTLKEIRFQPAINKHDLDIKLGHARDFIQKGHKVQFTLIFKGRQMLHKDMGYSVLNQVAQDMEDVAKVERPGALTGRRMVMIMIPK